MSHVTNELSGIEGWKIALTPRTHVQSRECCGVYFIRCGNYVKIGQSVNIQARAKDLQAWNPFPVKVVAYIACTGQRMYDLENEIHRLLGSSHHQGEWFKLSNEVKAYIRTQATRWEDAPK